MKITLTSPAAGYSTGDTGEVEDGYAQWLIDHGYATAAAPEAEPEAKAKAPRRPRNTSAAGGQ